ncbi:U-box domain [Dillenia turbinata]|uniref:RING-type E3 ubiquitin transferase n=1 Tax=Dillenia turbinata TaxID=194707 RepID=A0AAN8UZA2_9MAGN
MGSGKNRWKIFRRSSSPTSSSPNNETKQQPQKEFLCPISGTLMSDPVIVSSGQTFERLCVQVCKDLDSNPTLQDGSKPDFSTIIPNLALKSTILTWCSTHGIPNPSPPDYLTVEKIVRALIASSPSLEETSSKIGVSERELLERIPEKPQVIFSHAATELGHRVNHFSSGSSSEESVIANIPQTPVHLFTTRPSCYSSSASSSSSSSLEIVNDETLTSAQNPNSNSEEGEIWVKLKSLDLFMQEEGVIELRKITRNREETRVSLCTPRILSAVRSLILSRYVKVQSNAVAAVVNLSLEKSNKVKIVRSGMVPPLIDALKGGFPETQDHASGALFSLALEDDNKTAIGVLGALPPLLHALRSESERTRHDSALALYHLTLVHSNRVKLVKLNAVPSLLTLTKSNADMAGRSILMLCNLAACPEGKSAILDCKGVECLVTMLRNGVTTLSESTKENCVVALYSLSIGSLRFKGLAKEAGAAEVLRAVEAAGSERAREKAKRMLQMMRERGGEDGYGEEVDWEEVLNSDGLSRARYRLGVGGGKNVNGPNSTDF